MKDVGDGEVEEVLALAKRKYDGSGVEEGEWVMVMGHGWRAMDTERI